jgi:hypothetical protein
VNFSHIPKFRILGCDSCLEQGGRSRSRGDTWRPRSCPAREAGTTPPPPLLRLSACDQGVVVPVTPQDNSHRMITRGKTGFKVVPNHFVLTIATSSPTPSPIPSSARAAFADPHWHAAMEDEYGALISNGTWELVPRPQGSNVVIGKWVFTHKLHADGTLDRYKAPLGPSGFHSAPRS